jgi:hypothetical protein
MSAEAERAHGFAKAFSNIEGNGFETEFACFDLEKSKMSLITVIKDSADNFTRPRLSRCSVVRSAPSAKKEREPRRVRQLEEMAGPSSKLHRLKRYTQGNSFLHGVEAPVGIILYGFGAARR